ncbi:MAG TPA: CHRD domain-containing protein [Pyrinomonadaceae bacterium]|nr:CHRD domain-containing protein [Pyrinomonadaceae bacterium]
MKRFLMLAAIVLILIAGAIALAQGFGNPFVASLEGYQEVPAVSTIGNAEFRAELSPYGDRVNWSMTYLNLEGNILQSHIHFGQKSVNGGIVVFLCTNLGNGPVGTQLCPPPPATITGSFSAADVTGGAAAQGIGPGQYNELLRAMRAGKTYANIHSNIWPGGEIRSQIAMQSQLTQVRGDQSRGEDHGGH